MNHINNFSAPLTKELSVASDSLPLPAADLSRLSSGNYTLTLAPALGSEVLEHEIISYKNGIVERAQEGTTAKDWPKGTLVYSAVTAKMLTAAQSNVSDLVDRVVRETGAHPPAPYEYKVSYRTQDYYGDASQDGLALIAPVAGGIAAARSGYDTYYDEPPSVLIAMLSEGSVSTALNPAGVNWSRWGDSPHGYEGFSGVAEVRGDVWLMPVHAGAAVRIDLSGRHPQATDETLIQHSNTVSAGGFAIGDKIYTPGSRSVFDARRNIYSELHEPLPRDTQWVVDGSQAIGLSSTAIYRFNGYIATKTAGLSRSIDAGLGPVWVGRNGHYYAHDFTVSRLIRISAGGTVTECAASPASTLYAQGPDGSLLGLSDSAWDTPEIFSGIYDTSTDTYADITDKVDIGRIERAVMLNTYGGRFVVRPIHAPGYAAVAASSGGVFYFVLSLRGRWSVIAISKR